MVIEPVTGTTLRFPPGRVAIRLGDQHRAAYKRLYARYRTILDGLPVLRERDFDGRALRVTRAQLDALNRGFASLADSSAIRSEGAFGAQERTKNRLAKKTQFLS